MIRIVISDCELYSAVAFAVYLRIIQFINFTTIMSLSLYRVPEGFDRMGFNTIVMS